MKCQAKNTGFLNACCTISVLVGDLGMTQEINLIFLKHAHYLSGQHNMIIHNLTNL